MDLHPYPWHDDRPGLIDCLEHGEEEGETDAACNTRPVFPVSFTASHHFIVLVRIKFSLTVSQPQKCISTPTSAPLASAT